MVRHVKGEIAQPTIVVVVVVVGGRGHLVGGVAQPLHVVVATLPRRYTDESVADTPVAVFEGTMWLAKSFDPSMLRSLLTSCRCTLESVADTLVAVAG